jgi:hypothetical protein
MAERVVHVLELVEVHDHQRKAIGVAPGSGDGPLGAIPEEHAVRETGERVVKGLMREIAFGDLACRDVSGDRDRPPTVTAPKRLDRDLDRAPGAVWTEDIGFERVAVTVG